jgi:hypothetical protein
MKSAIYTALLLVFALSIHGCGNDGGGSNDASENCEDVCDLLESCDAEGYNSDECADICDDVDAAENDVSDDCQSAIADLFECVADDDRCSVIDGIDLDEIEDAEDIIGAILEIDGCDSEIGAVVDDCDGEIDLFEK